MAATMESATAVKSAATVKTTSAEAPVKSAAHGVESSATKATPESEVKSRTIKSHSRITIWVIG